MAGIATTGWPVPKSASCSNIWFVSHRHGRSDRCGRAPVRHACARREPATTTWRAGSAWLSWGACWIARRWSADGRYDPHRDSHDALSSPGHDLRYELTDTGRGFLTGVGVEIPTGKRPLVRYCVDWTEQHHHLSDGLGRAVFDRFLSAGWVKRVPRGRALLVTDD